MVLIQTFWPSQNCLTFPILTSRLSSTKITLPTHHHSFTSFIQPLCWDKSHTSFYNPSLSHPTEKIVNTSLLEWKDLATSWRHMVLIWVPTQWKHWLNGIMIPSLARQSMALINLHLSLGYNPNMVYEVKKQFSLFRWLPLFATIKQGCSIIAEQCDTTIRFLINRSSGNQLTSGNPLTH